MEAVGATASIITIWDITKKTIDFGTLVKDAPETWKRYCDGLRTVACIQTVLEKILKDNPQLNDLPIDENGKTRPFLKYINENLTLVKDAAQALLDRCDQTMPKKSARAPQRFLGYIDRLLKAGRFVLKQEQISGLISGVERAERHLQSALTLAFMHTLESWKNKTGNVLDFLKVEMLKLGKGLKDLKKETKKLRDARLVYLEASSGGLEPNVPSTVEASPFIRSYIKRKVSKKIRSSGLGNALADSVSGKPKPAGSPSQSSKAPEESRILKEDQHDADDEFDGNDDPHQNSAESGAGDPQTYDQSAEAVGYIFDENTRELFQVPVDTADYRLASGPFQNPETPETDVQHSPNTIRADEFADSMSSEDWENAKDRPIDAVMALATSDPGTAYATDGEVVTTQSWVALDIHLKTYILIAETVKLELCRERERSNLHFCVEQVSVSSDVQVFCLAEPCHRDNASCKHIMVEIEDEPEFDQALPCKLELAHLRFKASSGDELGKDPSMNSIMLLFQRCLSRYQCPHSLVEDSENKLARCSPQMRFCGFIAEIENTMEGSDNSTERAPSEPAGNQQATNSQFFIERQSDDDEIAFNLLRNVMLDKIAENSSEIELGLLVRFLSLAEKYRQEVGGKPLMQARIWISSFRPSAPFDRDSITWLWVMWKLSLGKKFRELSSIIQQQAPYPVSHWLNGPGNRYGIKLPERMSNLLDQRRSAVLSRLGNKIGSEIEAHRKSYFESATKEIQYYEDTTRIMSSSLVFGYLQLEIQRWLTPRNAGHDNLDFPGVSFAIARYAIHSMIDVGGWKVCTVPPADKIPEPIAMLSIFIPVLGAGLHAHGLHRGLREGFRDELLNLIMEVDREGWGFELADIEK